MKKKHKIALIGAAVLVVAAIGIYFLIKYQTYTYVEILKTYENSSTDNANYKKCKDGILRYSRDGIALLTDKGEEQWNQPCQMGNPFVETSGNSIAVGDKGGTSILVFQRKGLKGEIHTTRPIEKMAISSQGIVSAILKDEEMPLVMCYDAKGNILVENKVSLKTMGYPVDVAISEDGNTLLVSYLHTQENKIVTKVVYYYFGGETAQKEDYQVLQEEFDNAVVPVVTFLNKDTSLLVADKALIFYEDSRQPKASARVEMTKEIQSVAYNEDLVAVVLKNSGDAPYVLQIYNTKGKLLSEAAVEKEYTGIKVEDGKVLMYDGQSSSIFLKGGIHKYQGNLEENILEIFPIGGLNKYMVINANGFHEIKLVK